MSENKRTGGGPLARQEWARSFGKANELSMPARLLLFELTYRARPGGQCWPSQTTLSLDTGMSKRTIVEAVKQLIEAGAIQIVRSGRGGVNGSNEYLLSGAADSWQVVAVASEQSADDALETAAKTQTKVRRPRRQSARAAPGKVRDVPKEPEREPHNEPDNIESAGTHEESTTTTSQPRTRKKPSVTEEFILRMEKKHANDPIDVRFQIALGLLHDAAKKYPEHELYIQNWLNKHRNDFPQGGNNGHKVAGRGNAEDRKPSPLANLPTGTYGYDPGA